MRVYIDFEFDRLELPIEYNHILHGFVLNIIEDEDFRRFIHDEGYSYEKRKYKMFCFSRLLGSYELDKQAKVIRFHKPVTLIISAYNEKFIELLIDRLSRFDTLALGRNLVKPVKFTIFDLPETNFMKVSTKSPVTVYSTVESGGKKVTIYHEPNSEDFVRIVKENLKRKYFALHGKYPEEDFEIVHVGREPKKVVVVYKDRKIDGWLTCFDMKGPYEILKIAYDTGIGSKNSAGFGCIELVNNPVKFL